MMRPKVVLAGLLVVAGFAACDSATEPGNHRAVERVLLERVVTDEVAPDDTSRSYSFVPSETGLHGVFVQGLEGQANFRVLDSATGAVRAFVSLRPRIGSLEEEATVPFQVTSGTTYIVHLIALPAGSRVRFRFQVHHIDPEPEHQLLPVPYHIGDVVSDESIDDILDFDDYTATLTAGQEIAAAIKATGAPGTEGITVTVLDPSQFFQTYTFTSAGEPGGVTGRLTVPTSGTYRFRVQGIYGAKGRYTGPFRFWTYFINRAPEHHAAAVNYDTEITGEDLAPAGDVDEFAFYADAGSEYNIFLQSTRSPFVRLQAFDAAENYVAFVDAVAADTGLFAHATGRFLRVAPGTVTLRVFGESDHSVSDTGAYRLYVDRIDPLPEHISAAIVPGDTVTGELIDRAGDVDEFTFSGNAGDEMSLAFQALPQSDVLRADILSPGSQSIAYAETFFPDTTLYQSVTGMFTLPATGTYRVRVASPNSRSGNDTGPYRFFLYRISRQPESTPSTLALGDSLTGEAIEVAGDIDEYRVAVPDSIGANLVVELDSPPLGSGTLFAEVIDSATGQVKGAAAIGTMGLRTPSGRMKLGPGTHIVRVSGGTYLPRLRGSYRIWVYKFGFDPETVADTFAIGDTVAGESIEPWGDADVFHFYGARGQHVNIAFQGMADPSGTAFLAWIDGPPGSPVWTFASVSSPTSATALHDHQTMRLDLPVTGWYHITVSASGAAGSLADRGPYRFVLEAVGAAPEVAPAALTPGDSVTESIDAPADWDEFTVTATAGQELYLIFGGATGGYPQIQLTDGVTGDSLAANVGQGQRVVGPVRVGASGQVAVAVYQPASFVRFCYDATCSGIFTLVTPYAFRVMSLNRAPETAGATFSVGDTVRGEAITPIGDVDDFTASATPGAVMTLYARLLANPVPPGIIRLEIFDPTTGTVLHSGSGLIGGGSTSPFYALATFTVPPSGSLGIRFKGYGYWGDELGTAPYEFTVTP